jgi:GcrA cell cycle regulator
MSSWTDERVALLKKLWADGLSASQITAELGSVTRNAVLGKVHRLGIDKLPRLERKPNQRRKGIAAAARTRGLKPNTVYNRILYQGMSLEEALIAPVRKYTTPAQRLAQMDQLAA